MQSLRLSVATCVFALLIQVSFAHAEITLIEQGKSPYVIVVGAAATPPELRGAREIQSHLKQMTGVELPVVAGPASLPSHAILVGNDRFPEELAGDLGPEGFVIRTSGTHVVLAGSSPRATLYGCTTFLEILGVRWFTPKVTHVPRTSIVTVPDLDERQSPAFEYREPFFFEAFDKDWAARLRINGHHAQLDDSTGGHVVYGRFVHTFDELVPQNLFESHPEYFPLINGKRTGGYVQRCLTHPDVLRLTTERVEQWINQNPRATIFSVSQNDTANFCQCESCKQITEKYAANSGLYLWFVNQVAAAIEKNHPDKLIDTLAYQFTEAPPTGIAPRRNVRVRLCPISCCEAHPYEQCSAEPNRAFVKNLAAWSKITDTLYIWHYNTNFANYLMPFPDFAEFPAEARLYKRSGVKGVFFQGAYAPGGGGSDSELRAYVMSKLLWDVNVDTDALVSEWMNGVYGKAAPPMRQWFDVLHQKARDPNAHFFIFDSPTKVPYLTPDVIQQGDRHFDESEELAADDPVATEYLAKARLGLRYVKLMQKPAVNDEFRSFMNDVRKFGITQLREGQPIEQWEKQYLDAHGQK